MPPVSSFLDKDTLYTGRVHFPLDLQGQANQELVIHGDVSEKVSHGLAVVDSPNCFRKNQADIHSLYLGTLQLLDLMRDCICYHHLVRKQREYTITDVCLGVVTLKAQLTFSVLVALGLLLSGGAGV